MGRQTKTNRISKRNIVYVELISANGKSSAYWNHSGKAWYQALHEPKFYYLNIYALKYYYCYLTCEPQRFSSVEWVVMNTLRGIIRTKWNQALSLVLGTKVLPWLSLTFLRLLPQAHSTLALWGRGTVVSASFLVTCLQGPMEEENPAPSPESWDKILRSLDQLSWTNLIPLDIGTSCISHQWELSMSHITKQYVLTPPQGEAGEVVVCSWSFAELTKTRPSCALCILWRQP